MMRVRGKSVSDKNVEAMEYTQRLNLNGTNDKLMTVENRFNSFALLSFEKMVIFEVSMMGAVNMALRPDVKHKIV